MSELRQRSSKASSNGPVSTAGGRIEASRRGGISLFEIGRTIVFLFLTSCTLSWLVTKQDFFWGHRPAYTRYDVLRSWLLGPLSFSEEELKLYDGSSPTLPIYVALNGSVYDVSNGRKFYGPGGSYHFFAGAEATRAFVTTCFDSDISADMRGVEAMFLPLDDATADALYGAQELAQLKAAERERAAAEVRKALQHWVDFFENSPKYAKVGTVRRPRGWEQSLGPEKKLCKKANDLRKKRKPPVRAAET